MSQTRQQVKCKWCGWVGEEHDEPLVCRQVEREATKDVREWKAEQKAGRKRSNTISHGGAESVALLDEREKAADEERRRQYAADKEWLRQREEGAKLLTEVSPSPEVAKEMAATKVEEYEWNKDVEDVNKELEEKKMRVREADFLDLERALREEWEAKKAKEVAEQSGDHAVVNPEEGVRVMSLRQVDAMEYDVGHIVHMDANPGAQIVLGKGVQVMSLQQVDAKLKEMTAPPEGTVAEMGYEVVDGPTKASDGEVPPSSDDTVDDSSESEVDRDCSTASPSSDEVADATDGPNKQRVVVDDVHNPNQHFYANFWGCWDPEIHKDLCVWMNYVHPDDDDYFSEGEEANMEAAVYCKKSERVYEEMQARLLYPKRVAAERGYAERDPLVRIEDYFYIFHWGGEDESDRYRYVSCVKWPANPLPEFPPFWKGIVTLPEPPYYKVERRRRPLLSRCNDYATPEVEVFLDYMVLSVVGGIMAEWMLKGREAGRYYFPWKEWEALYRHIVQHKVERSVIYACDLAMNVLMLMEWKNKWELYVIRKMMRLCSGTLLAEFLAKRHHLADLGLLSLHGPYTVRSKEGMKVPGLARLHLPITKAVVEAAVHGFWKGAPRFEAALGELTPPPTPFWTGRRGVPHKITYHKRKSDV